MFKPIAKAFSGVEGSRINKGFNDQSNNGIAYVIYVLKKQNDWNEFFWKRISHANDFRNLFLFWNFKLFIFIKINLFLWFNI